MKRFLLAVSLSLFSLVSFANETIPSAPQPFRYVNDYTHRLTADQNSNLELQLTDFSEATAKQICVVLVEDLGSYSPREFALLLGERWGLQENRDGVVVLVKVRNATGGEIYIATGPDLREILPDSYLQQLLDNDIIPLLKEEQYYEAMELTINTLIPILAGEKSVSEDISPWALLGVFVGFILAIIMLYLLFHKIDKKRRELIASAIRERSNLDKEDYYERVKNYFLVKSSYDKLYEEIEFDILIAPALEDGVVTEEEKMDILQRAAAKGYSRARAQEQIDQAIEKLAKQIIMNELKENNGELDREKMINTLLPYGLTLLCAENLINQTLSDYRTTSTYSTASGVGSTCGGAGGSF